MKHPVPRTATDLTCLLLSKDDDDTYFPLFAISLFPFIHVNSFLLFLFLHSYVRNHCNVQWTVTIRITHVSYVSWLLEQGVPVNYVS